MLCIQINMFPLILVPIIGLPVSVERNLYSQLNTLYCYLNQEEKKKHAGETLKHHDKYILQRIFLSLGHTQLRAQIKFNSLNPLL
jgi:hypothetical protein